MVDSVKNYGITGVGAVVELGKQGPKIDGSSADEIAFKDKNGNASVITVAEGVDPEHAVALSQLNTASLNKYSYQKFEVAYNSGTVALANAVANTYIHSVVVEKTPGNWTGADANTTITVGDSSNNARLFTAFDPTVQTTDEADYRYASDTTINAYVTAGGASAGNAYITLWYSGTLTEAPAGGGGSGSTPSVTSNLIIRLDAGNVSSYSGSGTTWTDIAGSYNGTLTNGATYSSDNGGVIRLDGTDDYVNIADNAAIRAPVGSAITIQMWAKISNAATGEGLFSKQFGSPSYDGFSLVTNTNNRLQLNMNGGSVNGIYVSGSNNVWTTDTWHLFTAIVHFGGNSKVYVNTSKVIDANNGESSIPSPGAPLRIGQGIQDSAGHPAMDIGEFYFYDKALTEQEITDNYNATKSRYGL